MRTNHQDTSLAVYRDLRVSFSAQELRVLAFMKRFAGPVTINEVAAELRLPSSTVSGRLNDLLAKGVITDGAPKRTCRVGNRLCKVWRLTTEEDRVRRSLFERRAS